MKSVRSSVRKALRATLIKKEGKLTREMLLEPAAYGLGRLPRRKNPDATTTAVCGYCSIGCGLNIHLKAGAAVGLSPSTNYPVNLGMACPKGWEALSVLKSGDRAQSPCLRDAAGILAPATWDLALRTFTARFKQLQAEHGADSVAWLGTGQIPTEELALLGALAKFGMGIVHGDGNTRQCMATAAVAYKQSFGFDAPPYAYKDLEESDTILLVGSNLCITHPILWERVLRNPNHPGIVVIDPRRTETAAAATLHLKLKPKSDLVLFYAVANILIRNGWVDHPFIAAHTESFDGFAAHVRDFSLETGSASTGIPAHELQRFAELIHRGKRVSFWWTMGVNQSHEGVRTAQSLIDLALMTGNIGRPGTGANSITGQCNAMGSRLFSNTTNLLGGRDFTNADDRASVAKVLNIDASRIPAQNSLSYHEIVDAIHAGSIKGLWIVATNSAHSWIHQQSFAQAAKKLQFLVVQDMYVNTETAALADLVLPAAGWGEKEGTFINSERRIGLLKKVARAPGEALSDFAIFKLIAHYWGCAPMFERWESPEAVFQILKELSRGQPCDFSGIRDYQAIDEHGGIQWPLPEGAGVFENERRLFADGTFFHANGRARFLFESPRPMPEAPDAEFPLLLITGRGSVAQWHTQTRTAKSPVLRQLYPEGIYAEINPADARACGIEDGAMVAVESRRGRLNAAAFVSHTMQTGQIFIPMHYAETNRLTFAAFDPYSKQPSYKACAVKISPGLC